MAGAYFGTQLVFDTVVERLENQLIGATRVAEGAIRDQTDERLIVLRQIVATENMAEALLDADRDENFDRLDQFITAIAANTPAIDSVIILDQQGNEELRLDRALRRESTEFVVHTIGSEAVYGGWAPVGQILMGQQTLSGGRIESDAGTSDVFYSIGPLRSGGDVIGVVMVGSYMSNILEDIRLKSLADVIFYDEQGQIRAITLPTGANEVYAVTPDRYNEIVTNIDNTQTETLTIRGHEYIFTFAPFRMHGSTLGVYSVGLVTDFVTRSGAVTRNVFTVIIFTAISVLMLIALLVTRQIIRPLAQLVRASGAIAAGDLSRATGIESHDEIGRLAVSFDQMTSQLRKRTEQLEELVKVQSAILSSIADGVLVQDEAGNLNQWNPAAQQILARLSEAFPEFQQNDQLPLAQRILNHLAQTSPGPHMVDGDPLIETTDDMQVSLGTQPGQEMPRSFDIGGHSISTRAAPVITDNHETLGSVVVLRDVTDEIAAEKLKKSLIRSISHELLTPLVPIKGYAQLFTMSGGDNLTKQQIGFIHSIEKSADELNDLISTLIDFVQIEAEGAPASDLEEFSLDELVHQVDTAIQTKIIDNKDITIQTYISDGPFMVKADKGRIRRVINSLLDNAIKYNQPGGRADLHLKRVNDLAQISVVDTGSGVDASLKATLFNQPFIRSIEGDDDIRGGGLGLYLARKIVEANGGKIWYDSVEDQGSTFTFTIPLIEFVPMLKAEAEEEIV